MKIVVTGGAGFIGSHFVHRLLDGRNEPFADAEVHVLDKLTYAGSWDNLAGLVDPRLTLVTGDVCDEHVVRRTLEGADAVVHFAAESHVDRSIAGGTAFVTSNVLGTVTLLEAATDAGVGRMVHVSTDEVYGSVAEGCSREDDPLDPSSPYSASKASADLLVLAYGRTHGLDVRVVRPTNTYGPRQYPEKIIPLFVTNLLAGRKVPLYGDGQQVREWLHVDDHCRAVQLVLEDGQPGAVYNVGGGHHLTNRELTERLLIACGRDWSFVDAVPDRPGSDRRYAVDTARIASELSFKPDVDFDTGLARTVAWYRENRDWWERRVVTTRSPWRRPPLPPRPSSSVPAPRSGAEVLAPAADARPTVGSDQSLVAAVGAYVSCALAIVVALPAALLLMREGQPVLGSSCSVLGSLVLAGKTRHLRRPRFTVRAAASAQLTPPG